METCYTKQEVIVMDTVFKQENNSDINYYYDGIRQKLISRLDEIKSLGLDISYSALQKHLKDQYGFDVTERTLKDLFNEKKSSAPQAHLIVAVLNTLGMNLYDTLQYPDHKETELHRTVALKNILKPGREHKGNTEDNETVVSNGISFLKNPLYLGSFHCYYFAPLSIDNATSNGKYPPKVNYIRTATLEITQDYGETTATFTETNPASGNAFTLVGRVLRLENVDKIYIFLSEKNNGNSFIWLLFDDVNLKKRELYFKECGMMSHSIASQSQPIFQKMIITKNSIDLTRPDNDNFLRGILTFDTETIFISEKEREKFLKLYPNLDAIFDCQESFFKVSQYDIINSNRISLPYKDRAEALLTLMSFSNNHTQSVISQERHMHTFFFNLQGLK